MMPTPLRALATDYDGTIATHGVVGESTIEALRRLRAAGGVTMLVTGREIPDLHTVFAHFDLFDIIVAENGALLYWPETKMEKPLCDSPEPQFVEMLKARGVAPLSVGAVIVATFEPHENTVLQCIRELGLERQVIFNKGAVMVLPSGINKASGLKCALEELGMSAENVVGVGDAENDHALLQLCGLGAAVSNALPSLKANADLVLDHDHGAGVEQLIGRMLDGSIATVRRRERTQAPAHKSEQGTHTSGTPIHPNA